MWYSYWHVHRFDQTCDTVIHLFFPLDTELYRDTVFQRQVFCFLYIQLMTADFMFISPKNSNDIASAEALKKNWNQDFNMKNSMKQYNWLSFRLRLQRRTTIINYGFSCQIVKWRNGEHKNERIIMIPAIEFCKNYSEIKVRSYSSFCNEALHF